MSTAFRAGGKRAMSHILVTGGCGFIGCNIADALAARGERVVILDSMARDGAHENAAWLKGRHRGAIEIVTGDVRDRDAVASVAAGATAVFHLAAQVAVTTSIEDPTEDFAINAGGTLNVLEAVRRHCPQAPVLFASTNKVYGKLLGEGDIVQHEDRYMPAAGRFAAGVGEQTPLDLYSPYGCSKGCADQYVHDYARVFGLRTVVLRMSCIFGPRQFGTEDQGWIAHFLIQAGRGEPITIFGDGRQVRDALFVDDAVAAWLRALERIDSISGRVFNLGGGIGNAISLRELVALIGELHGEPPQLRFDAWRPGDQPWYVSDLASISAALQWTPAVPLRAGVASLERWLSRRFPHRRAAPAMEARA